MDIIKIKKLEVFAKHGVLPEENALGQKFLISANLYCDTRKAGRTDDLADSVNYAEVSQLLKESTQETVFRLLERLAWHLTQKILVTYPQIQKVDLEIEKPWAPVLLPLETVSVCITREWKTAYLSIGSNMGNREQYLKQAIAMLEDENTKVISQSDFIETDPVGYTNQDKFLNGAVVIKTLYSPEELLEKIASIEAKLGRERKIHWGPRTIDLDIILYEDEIIQTEKLTIPHIEMTNRQFVLEPLCQIAPYAIHPVQHKTVQELRDALK
ncbi:MAG: 2-amino-4-hydroxy-6-hydroxymethyldihydropteridine diphosphokinase [Butyribacter sp.]|nr:2-amino-4-hydroxy-6-hydroxymethyldihydropteridine diphosphokinase [bacterium]MDY3854909.1 2-amino-4-hydroxy-6-hydroxymethyldihydropteridine diphosphokinase [Butyribacter sp.]